MLVMLALAATAIVLFIRKRWYRLPREPISPPALTPAIGFALYLAMFFASTLGAMAAIRIFNIDTEAAKDSFEDAALLRIGAYAAQAIIVAVYAWLVWSTARSATTYISKRPSLLMAGIIGVAALLVCWPIAQAVSMLFVQMMEWLKRETPPIISHETLQEMVDRPVDGWFLLTMGLVLVAAPVIEEVFYRGLFQETLRRLNIPAWYAILGTSALFAAMHAGIAQPNAVASLFVLSIGFSWAYEKTGRLIAPIVMHILFNAGNLLVAMLVLR